MVSWSVNWSGQDGINRRNHNGQIQFYKTIQGVYGFTVDRKKTCKEERYMQQVKTGMVKHNKDCKVWSIDSMVT